MEEQGVVLAVEPHHVVARLVEPVAEERITRSISARTSGSIASPWRMRAQSSGTRMKSAQSSQRPIGGSEPASIRSVAGAGEPGGETRQRPHRVGLGAVRDMRQRLVDPGGEGRGCRALRRRIDHLDAEAAGEGHRPVRERDVEIAEVGRQLGDVGERQLAGAGFDRAGETGGVGRHEVALDADLGSQREGCGLGEADRDHPVGKGRPGHVHAVEERLDRGDALRRYRHRQDAGLRTLCGEAEPEARIALAQIAQPDLDLVVAGRQVDRHLRRARQVAPVGRHPEALLAADRAGSPHRRSRAPGGPARPWCAGPCGRGSRRGWRGTRSPRDRPGRRRTGTTRRRARRPRPAPGAGRGSARRRCAGRDIRGG